MLIPLLLPDDALQGLVLGDGDGAGGGGVLPLDQGSPHGLESHDGVTTDHSPLERLGHQPELEWM